MMDGKNGNRKVPGASKISTVVDLRAVYPALVTEIKDTVIREIESWPIKKIRKEFPDLIRRICAEIGLPQGPDMKVKGFLLEEFVVGDRGRPGTGDPFSLGALRTYMELKGVSGLILPYVLPFSCPFTPEALRHYILIAEGGGDYERGDAARKAMQSCK